MQRSAALTSRAQNSAGPKKFNMKSFLKLIRSINPHYWELAVGLGLGLVATAGQLLVPTLAKSLINQLGHAINNTMVVTILILFIGSALVSAVSGAALGIFGEDVVAKLREKLWAKLLVLPVTYFDTTKS
ncbi:MAG: ABC transporter transmembrane domain-containing protein, partial [Schleiferilactobacillus harbinensis]